MNANRAKRTLYLCAALVFAAHPAVRAADLLSEVAVTEILASEIQDPLLGAVSIYYLPAQHGDALVLNAHVEGTQSLLLFDDALSVIAYDGMPLPGGGTLNAGPYLDTVHMDADAVVFTVPDNSGKWGVFRYSRGTGNLARIIETGAAAPGGGTFTFLRADATAGSAVVFAGSTQTTRGLYVWDGVVTPIADTTTPIPGGTGSFTDFRDVAASDGTVIFIGYGNNAQRGVYRWQGGALSSIVDTSTAVPGAAFSFDEFNNVLMPGGAVLFTGFGDSVAGFYTAEGVIPIADDLMIPPGAFSSFDLSSTWRGGGILAGGDAYFWENAGAYVHHGGALFQLLDQDQPLPGAGFGDPVVVSSGQAGDGVVFLVHARGIFKLTPSFTPAAAPGTAFAVDFEQHELPEGAAITAIDGVPGLSISGAILVKPGGDDTAFNTDNAGTGNTLTATAPNGVVSFHFAMPVQDLKLEIADIERSGLATPAVHLRVYDVESGGEPIETIVAVPPESARAIYGDRVASPIDFSRGFVGAHRIRRLEIQGSKSTGLPDYAIDNLSFATSTTGTVDGDVRTVPLPWPFLASAGVLLAIFGMCFVGTKRRP